MFVIIYIQQDTVWYLVEATEDGTAMWSKKWEYSQVFPTRQGADQFRKDFLSDRDCAVISLEDDDK